MYRIHGVAPHEFRPSADSLPALIDPDDRTAIREQIAAAFAGGVVAEFEFRVVRPDGEVRHIIARTEGAADPAGQIGHLTGTFQDVTERRQAEVALWPSTCRWTT